VVHLALRAGGEEVSFSKAVTRQEGSASLVGRVPEVPSGSYRVRAVVTNGIDIVRTKGIRVLIAGVAVTPSPSISPSPAHPPQAVPAAPASGPGALPVALGVVAVLVALGAIVVWMRRRSKVRPATAPPPSDLGFSREAREG
jgi:hypothetical protein